MTYYRVNRIKNIVIGLLIVGIIILWFHLLYQRQPQPQHQFLEIQDAKNPISEKIELTTLKYSQQSRNKISKKKLVLLWNPGWGTGKNAVNGWDAADPNCPFQCDYTGDKSLINSTDALVYHAVDFDTNKKYDKLLHRGTNKDQIWVFFRIEPPTRNKRDYRFLDDKINWTSTYRVDSDVPYIYGGFKSFLDEPPNVKLDLPIQTEESLSGKKLVGWMHSNCAPSSNRGILAKKLQEFITVDIFGRCSKAGYLKCSRLKCYEDFGKQYKFWLAFENSLCEDYVTEKLYMPLIYGMIPILYAHKSVKRLLPKGSYIDIWDFETVEDLANYIKFLDENPKEYLKYFEWRKYLWSTQGSYWCKLCTKLNSDLSIPKYYHSMDDWFYRNNTNKNQCEMPSGPLFDK